MEIIILFVRLGVQVSRTQRDSAGREIPPRSPAHRLGPVSDRRVRSSKHVTECRGRERAAPRSGCGPFRKRRPWSMTPRGNVTVTDVAGRGGGAARGVPVASLSPPFLYNSGSMYRAGVLFALSGPGAV
ncbi:hypothetical protein EVAR_51627_1 [Eumeta japonica]|uniref:Uncharacterized protein n=1 Tax=Eumeta variegata TaxID=151549 RepID=A0A4C1YHV6_EUMVA|nr:hypothetical protein EVAR_51627_1 [Eumeta japonica]